MLRRVGEPMAVVEIHAEVVRGLEMDSLVFCVASQLPASSFRSLAVVAQIFSADLRDALR